MKNLAALGFIAITMFGAVTEAAAIADPSAQARSSAILARSPAAAGIFEVQDNGDLRHIQSGLRCPAALPNLSLWHAMIFPSTALGADVGCDYGRSNAQKRTISKLTIFATRLADHASLDQTFASVREEVEKASPTAKYVGPAIEIKNAGPRSTPGPLGEFRSAEYTEERGGLHYLSDVVVAIRSGWMLEVRSTFSTDVSQTPSEQPVNSAGTIGSDMAGAAVAFLAVAGCSKGAAAP